MSFSSLCTSCSMTPDAVHVHSKLRRNSLVSDHEDIALLREKLTRIAVGRLHGAFVNRAEVMETEKEEEEGENERTQGRRSNKSLTQHFKLFSSLLPERSSTPPSSPQPRDVLKKQLKLKQQVSDSRIQSTNSWVQEDDGRCEVMMSVEDVKIMPIKDIMGGHAVTSPSWTGDKQSPRARMSIPGHLRALPPFNVFNQHHPEGLRKRKCVDAPQDGLEEPRASLKKTSSQINILVTSAGSLSRSSSTGREYLQTLAARQRLEQDHDMEDVGCTTQPQSPQNAHFGSKHGQLSACS